MQGKNRGNQTRFKTTLDKFDIDDVRFEDEGVITCRAENVFGVQETKVELTVLGECAGNLALNTCNDHDHWGYMYT